MQRRIPIELKTCSSNKVQAIKWNTHRTKCGLNDSFVVTSAPLKQFPWCFLVIEESMKIGQKNSNLSAKDILIVRNHVKANKVTELTWQPAARKSAILIIGTK